MKTYWRSGGIAPRILDLGTRWRWVVSFTPRLLYPQGKSPWFPLVYISNVMNLRLVKWPRRSRDSAEPRAVWSGVRVPAGAGNFSLHDLVQTGSGAHPVSYPMGTRGYFPGGHEADHSPLSSAEVKNVLSYTSPSPIRLHGVVLSKEKKVASKKLIKNRRLMRKTFSSCDCFQSPRCYLRKPL
jgi:hypothetical protein